MKKMSGYIILLFIDVYHKWTSYDIWFLKCNVQQTEVFLSLKKKKKEKEPEDIITLYMCTKNFDQMMYGSWDMVRDRCNCFSFWAIFCPFTPLLLPPTPSPPPTPAATYQPKKSKFLKNEKTAWRYHYFTYVYQKLWSDNEWFLRYGARQTDGWMDAKSDI